MSGDLASPTVNAGILSLIGGNIQTLNNVSTLNVGSAGGFASGVAGDLTNSGSMNFQSTNTGLVVEGNFTQTQAGSMFMLAETGNKCSLLTVRQNQFGQGGTANLAGTLEIGAAAQLMATDTLVPVIYNAVQGKFNQPGDRWVIGPQGGRIIFDGTYNAGNLTLKPPKAAVNLQGNLFAGSTTDAEEQWLATLSSAGEDLTLSDFTLSVDWGDGTITHDEITQGSAFNILAGHQFAAAGTYTVVITVTDDIGETMVSDPITFLVS